MLYIPNCPPATSNSQQLIVLSQYFVYIQIHGDVHLHFHLCNDHSLDKNEMVTYLSHLHEEIASQYFPHPHFIRKYKCVNTGGVEVMVLFDVS